MIKKHPQINHIKETVNVKWCVSKDPKYMMDFWHNLTFVFKMVM